MAASPSSEYPLLIFLDVDGVLLPVSSMSFGGGDLDDGCLSNFKSIIDAANPGARIIISSTWRNDPAKIARLDAALVKLGIPKTSGGVPNGVAVPTTDVTYYPKDLDERKLVRDRVDEIHDWLKTNFPQFESTVNTSSYPRWFAIDDMNLGVDGRMKGHFLKTDIEEGILRADVTKAIALIAEIRALPMPAVAAAAPPTPAAAAAGATNGDAAKKPAKKERPFSPPVPAKFVKLGAVQQGTVVLFNPRKGFGFISTAPPKAEGAAPAADEKKKEEQNDVFFHYSTLPGDGFRGVRRGTVVKFQVATLVEGAKPEEEGKSWPHDTNRPFGYNLQIVSEPAPQPPRERKPREPRQAAAEGEAKKDGEERPRRPRRRPAKKAADGADAPEAASGEVKPRAPRAAGRGRGGDAAPAAAADGAKREPRRRPERHADPAAAPAPKPTGERQERGRGGRGAAAPAAPVARGGRGGVASEGRGRGAAPAEGRGRGAAPAGGRGAAPAGGRGAAPSEGRGRGGAPAARRGA